MLVVVVEINILFWLWSFIVILLRGKLVCFEVIFFVIVVVVVIVMLLVVVIGVSWELVKLLVSEIVIVFSFFVFVVENVFIIV